MPFVIDNFVVAVVVSNFAGCVVESSFAVFAAGNNFGVFAVGNNFGVFAVVALACPIDSAEIVVAGTQRMASDIAVVVSY